MDTLYLIPGGRRKNKMPKNGNHCRCFYVKILKRWEAPSNLKKMQQRDKVTSLYCSDLFACLMLGHVMNLGQT